TTSRDLFEVDRQQGNVDVTLDHRLLTEEGRNNIAEDVKRNELGLSSLADVVTKDSVSVGDTFEHVDNVQKNLDVQKLVASQAEGKFAVILNNLDTATASEKQAAINAYAAAYAEVYGVNIDSALVVAVTKMTHGAHYMNGNGASKIVINDETMKNAKDYMTTLGHEVTHGQVAQGGLDSRENKTLNEEYASLMGGYSADNYAFVLENSGLGTVREGDINRHHGNQSALISRNSSNYLADEAVLPAGSIEYYLNQEEVQKKLSLLASCNQQGAGSAACQQLNQTNQLDHMRDAELQAACKDMSSPGCRAQIAKAQAALDSFDEGASPWDDTRLGQEQESIRTVLNDPSGEERQNQQAQLNALFDGLMEFTPGAGDVKGFVDAESGIDYLVAGLGLIPVAGDLLKKAKEAFSAGRVEEAKALLGKAQEHIQHMDADFDLPDLALPAPAPHLDKAPTTDLDVSGTRLGSAVGDVDGRMLGDIPVVKVDSSQAVKGTPEYEALNNPLPNTQYELDNGTTFRTNESGFVDEISFTPVDVKMPRDSRQTAVGKEGLDTDVGGHIQACRYGGTCDRYNLFPQDKNFNNSAYKRWENEINRALQNGDNVGSVKVRLNRADPNNPRPDSLEVEYQINGRTYTKEFENQAGG
ncbi:DNA/RNA non-specific endonuclease, partial [Photobacterium sp. CAU 1568]